MQIFAKPGKKFEQFGKYTLLKRLTSGGMAEICLAHDPGAEGMGRFVVIKRTLSQYSERSEFKDMFKTEGMVACNLKHRNIVPMYEFGIETNQFFLSLEYISGRNVRELLRKLKALKMSFPIQLAVYIIKEAASGLDYAHNVIDSATGRPLNLIHRDVSPQNIMLSFDGEIKLIDFGIAKVADRNLTQAGHLKGKFGYMSPEQTRGEKLDPKTDIFCLGIILWEMLAGERLFQSGSEMGSLKKIRACNVPLLSKINPKVPAKLTKTVHRALNKNRNMRHKTAAEFERDLTVFLNSTYPEFSQYDFNAFIKKVYSKEILKERETLRSYSTKMKEHIGNIQGNLLSVGEGSDTGMDRKKSLAMPSIDDPGITATLTETRSSMIDSRYSEDFTPLSQSADWEKKSRKKQLGGKRDQKLQTERALNSVERADRSAGADKAGGSAGRPGKAQHALSGASVDSDGLIAISKSDQLSQLFSETISKSKSFPKPVSSSEKSYSRQFAGFKRKFALHFVLLLFGCFVLAGGVWTFNNIESLAKHPFAHSLFSTVKEVKDSTKRHSRTAPEAVSAFGQGSAHISRKTASPAPPTPSAPVIKKVNIHTHPSGAQIWINREPAAQSPGLVSVPLTDSSVITIRKKGHISRSFRIDTSRPFPSRLDITLRKIPETQPSKQNIRIID